MGNGGQRSSSFSDATGNSGASAAGGMSSGANGSSATFQTAVVFEVLTNPESQLKKPMSPPYGDGVTSLLDMLLDGEGPLSSENATSFASRDVSLQRGGGKAPTAMKSIKEQSKRDWSHISKRA